MIYENAKLRVELFDKVSEQKDITKGTSMNTKFANQSTERKLSLQPLRNNFVVRQPNAFQSECPKFSKTRVPQKFDEMNDLLNPVTSNLVSTPQESKVMKIDNVIALGMFRINPSKTSRKDKFLHINKVRASVRTNSMVSLLQKGHFAKDCKTARNPGRRDRDARNAGYGGRYNGKRPAREEDEKALVVQDRLDTYDWSYQLEEEVTDFALMGFTSNPSISSSSNSEENSLANDSFKKGKGFHAVPPPLTGNYMPPKPDLSFAGLDIIMANVPPNDPNVDALVIVPAPMNPDHAPAQPVGLGNGFAPYWIGDNIPNNQTSWIEEDVEEEEEDSKEDPEEDLEEEPEDDDDDMEMDDEAEVIDPYIDDCSNYPPPPNSKDEETPPTSPVIPDADGQPIPPIASFGQNFHFDESSSTANLLTGNSKIVPTGPMCPNLGTAWKRLGKMKKLMSKMIDTEGRIKKKFKEQDHHFLGLGCDNIKMDRTVRNVMSDLSGLKKLVKGLSDRFDEYKRSKVFDAKRVLEKELVNERNGKEFYREFGEYMCQMLKNRQKSEGSFPLPLSSQVREPPAEPSARLVLAPYLDDPYVVTRDAAIAAAAVATSGIDDDDDNTAPMDSQPHEQRGFPCDTQTMLPRKSTRGNPPPPLKQDTVNRMIQESVEAAIRDERERVQNEANRAERPNVALVAQECTFEDFMKCSHITFRGNEGAIGLIRWIEKTEMVFTVSKCTEANKVVFAASTFQDRALTWWNSQVATIGIEAVTRKTWVEMKVMMTEEFCPPEEI
nr:putative reverse transcriptase domain-containing protein [Tanacetum cinerariifolium]